MMVASGHICSLDHPFWGLRIEGAIATAIWETFQLDRWSIENSAVSTVSLKKNSFRDI